MDICVCVCACVEVREWKDRIEAFFSFLTFVVIQSSLQSFLQYYVPLVRDFLMHCFQHFQQRWKPLSQFLHFNRFLFIFIFLLVGDSRFSFLPVSFFFLFSLIICTASQMAERRGDVPGNVERIFWQYENRRSQELAQRFATERYMATRSTTTTAKQFLSRACSLDFWHRVLPNSPFL